MDNSGNVPSSGQDENCTPGPVPQPPYLTRDQVHEIMVYTLRQVLSSSTSPGGDDASSSNPTASDALPLLDAGPCPICGVTGCYGCAFPRHEEKKEKEKKHKGVRKKPSGNWSAEIWVPSEKSRRYIGTFQTYEKAVHAYEEAAAEIAARRATN